MNIINSLPKSSKKDGILLLDHLKNHSDVIKWNEYGKVSFRGESVHESNLKKMISHLVTNRKTDSPTITRSVFV